MPKKARLESNPHPDLPSPEMLLEMQRRLGSRPQYVTVPQDAYVTNDAKPPEEFGSMPVPVVGFRKAVPAPLEYPLHTTVTRPVDAGGGRTMLVRESVPAIGPLQQPEHDAYHEALQELYRKAASGLKGPTY